MGTNEPKVLLKVADRPIIWWVVHACRKSGVQRCIIVVGHNANRVKQALATEDCLFVHQHPQKGTAHATRAAEPFFVNRRVMDVFVLAGDGPLIRSETLLRLAALHRTQGATATLATAVLEDPTGYGRIIRDQDQQFLQIVEQKDATAQQLRVREVNPSYYCFRSKELFAALARVRCDNQQGEYYLTDVPALLKTEGNRVCVVDAVPSEDVLSINTPDQLRQVNAILHRRLHASDS